MVSRRFDLVTKDGLTLYGRVWEPVDVRAVLALVHGLGEHSGRYGQFAGRLGEKGFAVAAIDQRGFGRSPGGRGRINSYADLLDDIGLLLRATEQLFPDKRRFLYGHSMGGGLVLNYALRRRAALAGVVATSPWLRLTREPGPLTTALARALGAVWPGFVLGNGLDPASLSRDPAVVLTYIRDPLVHDRIAARLFTACQRAGSNALANGARFPVPLLLMHGSADRITSPAASREFAGRVQGDCTFRIWEGYYHELHNEPENGEFYDFLVRWLAERAGS
ncbi:MAG: lysophospholipase [Peptococcaceae bacterium]|nr:lysophospholipase [Peptococcaceae bacterium]